MAVGTADSIAAAAATAAAAAAREGKSPEEIAAAAAAAATAAAAAFATAAAEKPVHSEVDRIAELPPLELPPLELPPAAEPGVLVPAADVSPDAESEPKLLVPSWIVQHSLAPAAAAEEGERGEEAELFRKVLSELRAGRSDAASALFKEASAKHAERMDRPHLAFSSWLPWLFGSLQQGAAEGDASDAHVLCADLVRGLISAAPFGDEPPWIRPKDGWERAKFVRELCMQVGLSLDIARLGFVRRREPHGPGSGACRSSPHSSQGSPAKAATPRAGEPAGRDRSRTPRRRASRRCVRSAEIEAALKRAGLYLAAVQMDVHELNQEAVRANAKRYAQTLPKETMDAAAASPIPVEDGSPAKAEPTAVDEDTDSDEGEVYTVPTAPQAPGKREAPEHVVRSLASVALGDGRVPAKPKDASEDVDPLLVPTFGQFLDLQVLPLYVADVPFAALSNVVEDHAGLPLDSDDETRVWTLLGRPSIATEARAQRVAQKRRRQTARRAGKADTQPPVPPLSLLGGESGRTREALMQMLMAAAKPASGHKPLPRAQMQSSVVEKRRTDRSAPAGHQAKRAMGPPPDVPAARARQGPTSSAPAVSRPTGRSGTPTPLGLVSERSISRALFAPATPTTPAAKRAKLPQPSPQSFRGSGLTRSTAMAAAESGHTAMFDLMMDTPQAKSSSTVRM